MELTLSERKVITILERDARIPSSKIAKMVKLSTEGVIKIIRRLENKEIIKKFSTKFNYSKIGYEIYTAHIKLIKNNEKIRKQIMSAYTYPVCNWIKFCEGEYDLLLSFKIKEKKDKTDMDLFFNDISDLILEKDIGVALFAFEIGKSFTDDEPEMFMTYDHTTEKETVDLELLNLLKRNSRRSILEISKELGISARSTASKLRKLKKVISGFKVQINTAVLNYQPCTALISFSNYRDLKEFIAYCRYTHGINYLTQQMGKYDMQITIDAKDINDFYRMMDDMRERFGFIKKISTLIMR